MTKRIIELSLPFEHDVIGFIQHANRQFVAWSRDHRFHPFGTHEIAPNGTCVYGHYFEARSDALADVLMRATGQKVESKPERAANVEDGDDMGEGYEDERADPRDEPESPGYYFDEDGAHKY